MASQCWPLQHRNPADRARLDRGQFRKAAAASGESREHPPTDRPTKIGPGGFYDDGRPSRQPRW